MSVVSSIYKLEPILDNPKYEGFGMGAQPSLLGRRNRYEDLDPQFDGKSGEWVAPILSKIWKPLPVSGRVRPFNDFPCLGLSYPVFSQRAVEALGNILIANGELLPLVTSVGSYFLYNCRRVVDIIDFDRSKLDYLNKHTILEIDHLQVHTDRLAELSIFQIRKFPGKCLITDAVAMHIREAKLEGFEFRKLWPLPEHIPYWLHNKHAECHDELTAQPSSEDRPIKGNSVVLRLELNSNTPTIHEKDRVETIANEFGDLLVSPRKKAKYFGNLETHEFVSNEARLYFSCPDADELAKKLKPRVQSLEWPDQKWLLKRYGDFTDMHATEEYVQL